MTGSLWIISALLVLGVTWASAAPQGVQDGHHHHHQDYYAHPKYKYGYGVKDSKGDIKTAAEWRDGKAVKGHYSYQAPDKSWVTVNYVADEKGYRAQVHRTPNLHPAVIGHHSA